MEATEGNAPATPEVYWQLILALIFSLGYCQGMGDVADAVAKVMDELGLGHIEWDDLFSLQEILVMDLGLRRSLWGVELSPDDYLSEDKDEEGEAFD